MNGTKKRNIIIGSLCAVLLLMVVGYAAFQSVLKINGTTNISSDWDVRITNIEKTASVGATDNEGSPTYDNTKGLSATFNTNLTSPGDYATYKITITNNGSLDAVLKTITIPNNTNNDIIFYLNKDQNNGDISGALKENDTLTKSSESNNVGYVYVTVLYKDYANQQTATTKTASMTISFDFEQADGSSGPIIGPSEDGETASDKLINIAVTSGDGLYADTYEAGRYVYKGANPNNYITFNNETWRIMSVENDGTLKIIRNESLRRIYDPGYSATISGVTSASSVEGTRYTNTNTDYCYYNSGTESQYYGCNVWGSKTTMLDSSGNNITKMPREVGNSTTYNLPTKEAYLNTYLNNTWFNNLSTDTKALVDTHTWNVGLLKQQSGQTLETDLQQESAYKWRGKVGLINPTDYVKTNTNTSLCGNVYANSSSTGNYATCKTTSWLFNNNTYWTLSPYSDSYAAIVWSVHSTGYIKSNGIADDPYSSRPVLYLTSNIHLEGEGTSSSPYTIIEEA